MARWTLRHVGCHSHDTVAASYWNATSCSAGSVAEAAASRKEEKYAAISSNYLFLLLAYETFKPTNQAGCDFRSVMGHRLSLVFDDPRESFISLSASVYFYSALQLCLFLQLSWEPAGTIF